MATENHAYAIMQPLEAKAIPFLTGDEWFFDIYRKALFPSDLIERFEWLQPIINVFAEDTAPEHMLQQIEQNKPNNVANEAAFLQANATTKAQYTQFFQMLEALQIVRITYALFKDEYEQDVWQWNTKTQQFDILVPQHA